jgi:hypothetical protein
VVILHLGDHDPSGIDMTRDIRERLDMFIRKDQVNTLSEAAWRAAEKAGIAHLSDTLKDLPAGPAKERIFDMMRKAEDSWGDLTINRIALNMDQVEELQPPPNPAKVTDPRAKNYIAEHGYESWELDAIPPDVLDQLIQGEIETHIDREQWDADEARQEQDRALMQAVSDNWTDVVNHVREQGWAE